MSDQAQSAVPTTVQQFDTVYSPHAVSPTMARIYHEVFGDDAAPAEADAFSFVARSELERIIRELQLNPGQSFVDLACGAGGPGLWIARTAGLNVWGIDISPEGIAQATYRAAAADMSDRARYQVGEFEATGLPTAAFEGAISIDALWLAGDKQAALGEIARILRPGARLVVTTWEATRPIPDFPPQVADYRPLLQAAGFTVEVYAEAFDWERRQRGVYAGVLAAQEALLAELGEAARATIGEAMFATGLIDGVDYLAFARRVFFVAQRG